ncbi:RNA 3'-terminal phosphate cyclase domain-containing protein [Tribonema minus]|uniref:RNA 3'-terminal phosphate cyclase domain-containing protein n=1 Tax=Tribonema minus TaxID=303371 RepID=A0A835YR39_9STRA|nr:RNA 3'-terminal phosphate cyclase domain-containing protein [Tribonema minus]
METKKGKRPLVAKKSDRSTSKDSNVLRFKGCTHFRQRVVCAILSGKPIRIDSIRPSPLEAGSLNDNIEIGLVDYEASFLRLIDKLTNGTKIEINETGTSLFLKPGFVTSGRQEHDCGTSRCIGWFIEGVLPLALFSKRPLHLTLNGITNDNSDLSVDAMRAVTLPLLKRFGVADEGGLDLKVKCRGFPPLGGGSVEFTCPIVRQLTPVDMTDAGLIKRVRGNAACAKVSPQLANRVAESAKGVLNRLLPDVWVHTDHSAGANGGLSPGFACSLVAESTTGVLLMAETAAEQGMLPEDLGVTAGELLLDEISNGGCVDSTHQSLAMLLMVLCPEDVSRLRVGKLTAYSVQYLRHLRDFFGTVFKIKPDLETSSVMLSCLGTGYKNLSRSAT